VEDYTLLMLSIWYLWTDGSSRE